MELTQLRYFAAVAELQHVTRAAERMHVAQPAITKSIHRLEDELGIPLVASRGRNIVLTDYGRALYGMLREPLSALDQIPEQMRQLAQRSACTLHINVLAASRAVTDAVIAYKHDHSEILFSIMQNELCLLYTSLDGAVNLDPAASLVAGFSDRDLSGGAAVPDLADHAALGE